jgi:hypothetical protein
MWMIIVGAIAIGILVADLYSRHVAEVCDGCKQMFYSGWAEVAFWQNRVMRSAEEYAGLVKKEGEKAICVGCVEARRTIRAIDILKAKGEKFTTAIRNAEAKVDGTIRAEARKISTAVKDLEK